MKINPILTTCLLLIPFGMMAIMDKETNSPISAVGYPVITEPNAEVLNYISHISIDRMMTDIQVLQDFETRFFQHPNSTLAQNWLKAQYEMFGLEVELQKFDVPLPPPDDYSASDNIIVIQYGTEFPDEFVVCGAHYDSYSSPDIAPAPATMPPAPPEYWKSLEY
jgi:hypothetical protein